MLAALLAFALRWRYRDQKWAVLFGLAAFGVALHLLFDLVNSFGVVLLWPFSDRRFELACLFIIDPTVWALMGLPLSVARLLPSDVARLRLWRGFVGALFLYGALCYGGNLRSETLVRRVVGDVAEVRLFPEPLGPHRFRAAVRDGPLWRLFLCRPLSGACEPLGTVRTDADLSHVAEIRATPAGRRLEWFMAAPAWTLRPDGTVEVEDLRFRSVVVKRASPITVVFRPGDPTPRVR